MRDVNGTGGLGIGPGEENGRLRGGCRRRIEGAEEAGA